MEKITVEKLFELLESTESGVVEEVKGFIEDQLRVGGEEADVGRGINLLNSLIDYYFASQSKRTLEIFFGVRSMYSDHLLHRICDRLKQPTSHPSSSSHVSDATVDAEEAESDDSRISALALLTHAICRNPGWVKKVPRHPVMSQLIELVMSSEDPSTLMCAILSLVMLIPLAPLEMTPCIKDVFACFARMARWLSSRPAHVTEVLALQLCAANTALFHRLYALFPCNFLEFLRRRFGPVAMNTVAPDDPNNVFNPQGVFNTVIQPMLSSVRLHHLFITASSATEMNPSRWRNKEAHDVLMDISKVTLDPTEVTSHGLAAEYLEKFLNSSSFTRRNAKPGPTSDPPPVKPNDSIKPSSSLSVQRTSTIDDIPGPMMMVGQRKSDLDWNPAVVCGLATPPPSTPPLPSFVEPPSTARDGLTWSISADHEATSARTHLTQDVVVNSPSTSIRTPAATRLDAEEFTSSGQEVTPRTRRLMTSTSAPEMKTISLLTLERVVRDEEAREDDGNAELDREVSALVSSDEAECQFSGSSFDQTTDDLTGGVFELDGFNDDAASTPPLQASSAPFSEEEESDRVREYSGATTNSSSVESASVVNFMKNVNRLRFDSLTSDWRRSVSPRGMLERVRSCPILTRLNEAVEENVINGSEAQENSDDDKKDEMTVVYDVCTACGRNKFNETDVEISTSHRGLWDHVWPYVRLPVEDASRTSTAPSNDILLEHMSLGAEIHGMDIWNKLPMAAKNDINWTHFGGQPPPDEMKILKIRLLLERNATLFERQKRQLHARRNRHLLGRVVKAIALEEKNGTMKDQLRLLEAEAAELKRSHMERDREFAVRTARLNAELSRLAEIVRNLETRVATAATTAENRAKKIRELDTELATKNNAFDQLKQIHFGTLEDSRALEEEVKKVPILEAQLNRANNELILHGELQMKYQQRLDSFELRKDEPDVETEIKMASMKQELGTLKSALTSMTLSYEMAKARSSELESSLSSRESACAELKTALEYQRASKKEAMEAMEERYKTSLSINQQLECSLLDLRGKILLRMPLPRSSTLTPNGDDVELVHTSSSDHPPRMESGIRRSNGLEDASSPPRVDESAEMASEASVVNHEEGDDSSGERIEAGPDRCPRLGRSPRSLPQV